MNRQDAETLPLSVAIPAEYDVANTTPRLVVVIRDVVEPALLAVRIHQAAAATGRDVLMIGVSSPAVPDSEVRRKLALLAAFVRDAGSACEIRVENDLSWIPEFRLGLTEGDLLACSAGADLQAGTSHWIDLLAREFRRDIHVFTDESSATVQRPGVSRRIAPWLCSIGIVAGFTWMQISLAPRLGDAVSSVALVGSVLLEAAAIAWCNAVLD